jgi:predicted PurR-regulated permease PerM
MDTSTKKEKTNIAIEIAIKLGLLSIILFISFLIIKPFLGIVLWSIILAVALFPFVEKLSKKFSTSNKKVIITIAVIANLALILPTYSLSGKAIDSISKLKEISTKQNLHIPPPPQNVKNWPLIGEKTYDAWDDASKNLTDTLKTFTPQIKNILSKIISVVGDTLKMILFSIVAIIIASFLMIGAEKYVSFYKKISIKLLGEKGDEWATLTALTIRSVANGVIGVAVIQAALALIGLVVMDIHFSVVIAIAIMFLTIVQLPAIIVIGPVVALVLSQDSSTSSVIFSIYMLLVGSSDGILKPLLLGRGVDIPMLIILIGAIGGMILMGMIGLFIGAVIFSLTYKLIMLWLSDEQEIREEIQQFS